MPGLARITFHVQDPEGFPIAATKIDAESPNGAWHATTGSDGDFTAFLAAGHYDIAFSHPGYLTRELPADLGDAGTITVGLDRAGSNTGNVHLEIRGQDFLDQAGNRTVLNGVDQFSAFRKFLDGIDLAPLFAEAKRFNFNLWRVFFMGSKAQNGVLDLNPTDPGVYEKVRPFIDLVNSNGIIVLATINVDAQDKLPTTQARQANWTKMANLARGSATLLSGGNEYPKNGWDPGELSDPGMYWSRGSNLGDAAPYQSYASFVEFHPRRDLPKSLDDAVASATFLNPPMPLIADEPLGYAEANIPGKRSNVPAIAYKFGRLYSTMWAGAVFHSDDGIRSNPLGPQTAACAGEWARGFKLG